MTNGERLPLIADKFDVFLTIDSSLVFQQSMKDLPFAWIILAAKTNQVEDLEPLVPEILKAMDSIQPGQVVNVASSPEY